LDSDNLRSILCLLEPGMRLTLPDEWVDKTMRGTRAARASELREIGYQLGCALHLEMGKQTFEKLEYPRTG